MAITPEDFGSSFKDFLDQMRAQKRPEDAPFFMRRLREHFDAEPSGLPVLSESFGRHDHPNIHLAVEDYLSREGRSAQVMGVSGQASYMGKGLADLLNAQSYAGAAVEGPVQYANVALDGDRVLACVEQGLFLVRDGDHRLAVFVREAGGIGDREKLAVEVMAPDRASAERGLREIREAMRARNVYRGHVLSLSSEGYRDDLKVKFHRLPAIDREAIILPEGLLERVERQTLGFSRHAEALLAAGRHLRRGLLLHGPPGTGKTLTVMYLASAMRDRTVLLMTGRNLGMIGRTCAMARALQPAIVVLEDVDLIAEERTKGGSGCSPLLFELLNEMDGLSDDSDVVFLLTTNRPDLLEPALASRPGRVDQAIEVPLPDESCRRRLFALYGRGLSLRVDDLPRFIARTDGASAAFIRELLRRAALFAADDGGELVVADRHLDAALHDLVVQGGELTKSLLGYRSRIGFAAAVPETPTRS
jgi:hypothetical protein